MEVKPSIQQRFAVALIGLVASLALVATAHAGPKVESWQTSGGAKVMYVHAPDLPMVDVRVVLDAGDGVYRADSQLLAWERVNGESAGLRWSAPAAADPALLSDLREDYLANILTLERVILDLHSGRIFGRYGPWLMDAAAILLLVLGMYRSAGRTSRLTGREAENLEAVDLTPQQQQQSAAIGGPTRSRRSSRTSAS